MTTATTSTYVPDALTSLRDSFRAPPQRNPPAEDDRIYLAALDGLIAHLEAQRDADRGTERQREHVESYIAARRDQVKPATLSIEFRALQQFWRWALEEEEIDRSADGADEGRRGPRRPGPGGIGRRLPQVAEGGRGQELNDRRDTAILLTLFDTGIRLGELTGIGAEDSISATGSPTSRAEGGHAGGAIRGQDGRRDRPLSQIASSVGDARPDRIGQVLRPRGRVAGRPQGRVASRRARRPGRAANRRAGRRPYRSAP